MQINAKKSRQSHKLNTIDVITQAHAFVPRSQISIPNMVYYIDPDDYIPSAMRGKHILVLGASGSLGTQVVNQALESSYHVTVLVRSDYNLPFARHQLRNPNFVIMVGSVFEHDDLSKAIEGKDAVINCLGPRPLFSTDIDICSRSQSLIIESMKQHNVRRLIVVTSQDIDDDVTNGSDCAAVKSTRQPQITSGIQKFFGKLFAGKILDDKKTQEGIIIKNSQDIDWTIIRPGKMTNGQLTSTYKLNEKSNHNKISRANVAHFILKELRNGCWVMKGVSINS